MKKILGLDLGTTSIGWAFVKENEHNKQSEVIKLGVRVNPLSTDEKTNFEKGKPITTNAERTAKRGARRRLQRYKLRRKQLIELLIDHKCITPNTPLAEDGKKTTYQTLELRAKAVTEKIALEELARVFLAINKKRGYKSNRKTSNQEKDGQAIDGMEVAKTLYEQNLTPGQYAFQLLNDKNTYIPDFYRSDLQKEFDKVWTCQQAFYPHILTQELYEKLQGKNKTQTWAICQKPFDIQGIKLEGKATDKKNRQYQLRTQGLSEQLDLEYLAIVLQEINNNLNQSSGYLSNISERSKELYFNKKTVGQYLYQHVLDNKHAPLKNQIFYRQDYLDEFEQIWTTQAKFHNALTKELKAEIRDVIIFYQRKLKSQKGLLSFCQFESWEEPYIDEDTKKEKTRTVGRRVISKSSPLFQESKIWQNLNNLVFEHTQTKETITIAKLDKEQRLVLFNELNMRGNLKPKAILDLLKKMMPIGKPSDWVCNFEDIEGNLTNKALYNIYQNIAEYEGYGFDWKKKTAQEINTELKVIFPEIGIDASILEFDAEQEEDWNKQPSYQLWHLLYSAEDDLKISEEDRIIYGDNDVALKKKLHTKYGFKPEYTKMLANIRLSVDYGNLSSKAIRKILPHLKAGHIYSEACTEAKYNHSNSMTKEEIENLPRKDKLELLKKNSLRNPVVEKILNQMVNVVNQVIETYGKPDEIRIELARELKKNAKEREKMTKGIAEATKKNEDRKNTITKEFGIQNPTKNDVTRYRLWEELKPRGYKSLYTDKYIPKEKLFSKDIEIEHIIPQGLLFDDSLSNKTLAYHEVNSKKGNRMTYDFISQDYSSDLENYKARVEDLYNNEKGSISKSKRNKLLMAYESLPEGFIDRDLRNTQYIAKKAREMLYDICQVVIPTTGRITDKLREDWDLINVMKELNKPKYKAVGLTEIEVRKGGKEVEVIKDWTKRNDHRHHAMDALTIAFTTHSHIQYINNESGSKDKKSDLKSIQDKITHKVDGKRKFIPPMPHFRAVAKEHIESILISHKAKNKVVTWNKNKSKLKGKDKFHTQKVLTPRVQMHKETIYGKSKQPSSKPTKLNNKFGTTQALLIIHQAQKKRVLSHLEKYNNDPKIAFDSKTLKKDPLIFQDKPLKEVLCFKEIYTIRKDINPDNFKNEKAINKVIDLKVREVLLNRLKYGGNPKTAFSNLDKHPIWLNEDKGIAIKRVTITDVKKPESLHYKKDHLGNDILDNNGNKQAVDFISTGANHHVAIYKDSDGKLHDRVVSFYEAVARANEKLPIIDKTLNAALGWTFLFTMKPNELFIFPNENENFNPNDINLLDKHNATLISPHLFRVQKTSTKDYYFRHHLETTVKEEKVLKDTTFKRLHSLKDLRGIVKVRLNHIGLIVQVGEY